MLRDIEHQVLHLLRWWTGRSDSLWTECNAAARSYQLTAAGHGRTHTRVTGAQQPTTSSSLHREWASDLGRKLYCWVGGASLVPSPSPHLSSLAVLQAMIGAVKDCMGTRLGGATRHLFSPIITSSVSNNIAKQSSTVSGCFLDV